MNTPRLLLGLLLASPLLASDNSALLLGGKTIDKENSRVSGAATALVGDLRIGAEAIAFDREQNLLRCEGAVTIQVAGTTVRAKECLIELGGGSKRVFFLNPEGLKPDRAPAANP